MRALDKPNRFFVRFFCLLIAMLVITACQSSEQAESLPTATSEESITAIPISSLRTPQITSTAPGEETGEPSMEVTVASPLTAPATGPPSTSPVPTVEASPTPMPSATPPPPPTFHTVQSGDTLSGIAGQYGITLDQLLFANGYASSDQLPLTVGDQLQIPLCESHQIMSGNTLAGIADLCNIPLEDLVMANLAGLAPFGSLDAVPLGFVLVIPDQPTTAEEIECQLQPVREQVIEYTPLPGEGLFCLAQKFAVSTSSIIQANIPRLTAGDSFDQTALLIPPLDGAVYIVSQEDIDNGVTLEELAAWYDAEPSDVTDWNRNQVTGPLTAGRQLLIAGANLIYGPFQSQAPQPSEDEGAVEATPTTAN